MAIMKRETLFNIDLRWIAVGLFLLTVFSRLPFQSQYLYHWDSVNMAFGIDQFDVRNGAPQYPGYIVYIALAQVIDAFVRDPQSTMIIISIISSGLAVAALFYLGRAMFNAATGLIAALFIMTSPLVWFYGEIALPHTMDLFCIILAALLLYRIMEGERRWGWLLGTAVFLALVGGFRQQDLVFLGPLILLSIYRIGVLRLAAFIAAGFVTTLVWFIPLMQFTGGLQSYLAGSSAFTDTFFSTTSILEGAGITGLRRNVINKLIPYTAYAWSLAALPALYWLTQIPRLRPALTNRKFWFFVLWMAPALAFYIFIHMGQQGLVFVFLPALMLLSAAGLYRLFETRPAVLRAATAIITLFGAGTFILGPTYPLGVDGPKLLTYSTLQENDRLLAAQIAGVRDHFDAEDTLLLASNWRHIQYYLPEYSLARVSIGAKWEVDEAQVTAADYVGEPVMAGDLGFATDGDWKVVLVDADLEALSMTPLKTIDETNGLSLSFLQLDPGDALLIESNQFSVQGN